MMKLKPGFVVREVAGKTLAVAVGELSRDFHGMIALNGTGRVIWSALNEDTTEDAIVDRVLDEYEIDRETAARDVAAFIANLRAQGLILDSENA